MVASVSLFCACRTLLISFLLLNISCVSFAVVGRLSKCVFQFGAVHNIDELVYLKFQIGTVHVFDKNSGEKNRESFC